MQTMSLERWPSLAPLIAEKGLLSIDAVIALMLSKECSDISENALAFLCKLAAAARQGHLCLKREGEKTLPSSSDLFEDTSLARLLDALADKGVDELPESLVCSEGSVVSSARPLWQQGEYFYLQKNAFFEERFVSHLLRIMSYPPADQIGFLNIPPELNSEQKSALIAALSSSFCLITGGPGTGKTYTAAQIVRTFAQDMETQGEKEVRIILAAPTGKAAAHLEKNVRKYLNPETKLRAGTLHMLLSIRSAEDMMKPATPLHADLVIVDEASMIDARLFSYFLSCIEEGSKLVLMGDKDQLPPVDSGSLFADLVDVCQKTKMIPCLELKECLRSDKKQILDFARAINEHDLEEVYKVLVQDDVAVKRTALFCNAVSLRKAYEALWDFCQDEFPISPGGSIDPAELLERFDRFRILSCVRKGALGVDAINRFFMVKYREQIPYGEYFVCPILIAKNDYTLDLFNGDVGVLVQKKKKKEFFFEPEDFAYFYDKTSMSIRKISALMLPSFEYAYCLSVHKSQGSEYNDLLILAPEGSGQFGKEVLYTAITRAKISVVIDASDEVLKKLVSRSSRKISGLRARLRLTGGNSCIDVSLSSS